MKVGLIAFVCFLFLITPNISNVQEVASTDVEDIQALVLISDGCGWNYFNVTSLLLSWGVDVTIITNTDSLIVTSCPNLQQREITADVLLSEFDLEEITNFDCVMVPSGGQWNLLAGEPDVNEFLSAAYEEGLVLGAICMGSRTLAETNMFPNGTKVAMRYLINNHWRNGGCIPIYAGVVCHNRVVTGEAGSGFPGGYVGAPTYAVCAEVVREVLGLSRMVDYTIEPTAGAVQYNQTITVNLQNVSSTLSNINFGVVEEVTAFIAPIEGNDSLSTVQLSFESVEDAFIGTTPELDVGDYTIQFEICTENETIEVTSEDSFSIEEPEETPTPTEPDSLLMSIVILAMFSVAVVIILYVTKFRK